MSSNFITNRETDAFLEVQMLDEMNSDHWSLIIWSFHLPPSTMCSEGCLPEQLVQTHILSSQPGLNMEKFSFYYIEMKFRPFTVPWWIK